MAVKVYLSVDMEGVAGISDWEQCMPGGEEYALGRELLLREVNAAIDGAVSAGAEELLVNDAHAVLRNIAPFALHGGAAYLSGKFKPRYMMEGLDETFDAVLFLGYRAAVATPGALSHTYNPRAVHEVRINGMITGEAGINALVAQHYGVPVAVITGDQYVGPEVEPFCPDITHVAVKESLSRYAARHLHSDEARKRIREGVTAALTALDKQEPPQVELPGTLEIDLASPDMAEQATWIRGVDQISACTVSVTDDDPMRLFGTFVTLIYLTRSLVETR